MTTEPLLGCTLSLSADDLSTWRDGALDDAAKARLDAHIPGCAACRTRIGEYDDIAQALRAIPTAEPLHGFGRDPRARGTMAAERHTPAHPVFRHRRAFGSLGAVAAVVLLALGLAQVLQERAALNAHTSATATLPPTVAMTTVPNFVGVQLVVAQAQASAAHLIIDTNADVTYKTDPTVKKGIIMEQTPGALTQQPWNTHIQVTVSGGPEQVKVPDVSGKSLRDAIALLEAAQLKIDPTYTYVETTTLPPNYVLNTSPPAGTLVSAGPPIKLTVSKAPPATATPCPTSTATPGVCH